MSQLDPVLKCLNADNLIRDLGKIFIVAADAAKTGSEPMQAGVLGESARMAQTRRLGMPSERAHRPKRRGFRSTLYYPTMSSVAGTSRMPS